ncbi:Chitinase 2 [Coemansia sp. RSA 2681]|nr:Chitinase 2 [Coemansia sp. RSA 2681]
MLNSWGGAHLSDPANWEGSLASYCQDATFDVINISFVTNFNLTGLPVLNHAFHCETVFNGTNTLHCPDIGADIKLCQANGKKIVLSLGGGNIYTYGLSSAADGQAFADTIWNMFLGGSSAYRPYDDAVLDGVDLDIESGEHTGYPAFINQLRSRFSSAPKQYLISATPQCVYPDANLGSTLSSAWMDNTYVQFYNNPCNLANIGNRWNFDYASWDKLTKANANPNARMYVGLPAGTGAAGNGYLDLPTLQANLMALYTNYTASFGGIMLWDASWYSNNKAYVLGLANWHGAAFNLLNTTRFPIYAYFVLNPGLGIFVVNSDANSINWCTLHYYCCYVVRTADIYYINDNNVYQAGYLNINFAFHIISCRMHVCQQRPFCM